MQSHNSAGLWRAAHDLTHPLTRGFRSGISLVSRARGRSLIVGLIAAAAIAPASGLAWGPVPADEPQLAAAAAPALKAPTPEMVRDAKWNAAIAYDRYLKGDGSKDTVELAESILAEMTREQIGANDWSAPENTPAALKMRGEAAPYGQGALQNRFFPFEQITWWYCGPATAQSILWYLGPHRSESHDDLWGGRPWLTGNPLEDQWLLANDFWLATNKYGGTNWGYPYMAQTLNAWRGTFWYVDSATPVLGGGMTKEFAFMAMQYDFDREYPVAENVLYAPSTYYPFGFWPGIIYQHWDVAYGFVDDENGNPYVKIGQVYHDERLPYERFQQVAWDVHWSAIGNWHGIVW